MTKLIKRHPLASYFILAIALSWAGILLIVLPGPIPAPPAEAQRLFVAVYLAMLVGPSVAGLTVCRITGRRPGIVERLRSWRAGGRWYAVALLAAPVAMGITLLVLSMMSPDFIPAIISGSSEVAGPVRSPNVMAFVLMGLAVGLGAGVFEEIGWTGFAVPRMLSRHGILATGIGVGLVWGLWHFLAIWWGSADAFGTVPVALYLLVALFSFLLPYRVLMVWVYRHTRSLPVGIVMHASLTSSMLILGPAISGRELLIFDLVFAAVLWVAALVVVAVEARSARRHLAQSGAVGYRLATGR